MGKNRLNKRKNKKGCGCKMCKPHKGGWCQRLNNKDYNKAKALDKEISKVA